jgi:3-dehydroquinate dehydratase II
VVNAGAWSHYSWAIRDALEFTGLPAVEVHISDISKREEWRRHSVFDGLVVGMVAGKGIDGYRDALQMLKESFQA